MSQNKKIRVERYIQSYQEGGSTYFQIYICKRSKIIPSIKKLKHISSLMETLVKTTVLLASTGHGLNP